MLLLEHARLRHAKFYLNVITRANALWLKGADAPSQAIMLFNSEWANIEHAHTWLLAAIDQTERVLELISLFAQNAANILERVYPPEVQIQWFAAALTAARKAGREERLGPHLNNLALAYAAAGELEVAVPLYMERIGLAQRLKDPEGEAAAECNLGTLFRNSGKLNAAIPHIERSLELDRRTGNQRRECQSLTALGAVWSTIGDVQNAIEYYEKALLLARKIGYVTVQSVLIGNLANCWRYLGQRERALQFYLERIQLAREAHDPKGLALALANWSVLVSEEMPEMAVEACREALEISVREPRIIQGHVLNQYGVILRRNGDLNGALQAYNSALVIAQETGNVTLQIGIIGHLGVVMAQLGNPARAAELYEQQRRGAHESGSKRQEAWALEKLSSYYYTCGDVGRAITYAESALTLLRQMRDIRVEEVQRRVEEWQASGIRKGLHDAAASDSDPSSPNL